jgi:hypothetical protein
VDDTENLRFLWEVARETVELFTTWEYLDDNENKLALLEGLRDVLNSELPQNETLDVSARDVVAAFDEKVTVWVQAGVPASRYRQWDAYRFSAKDAGMWERNKVPLVYALQFRKLQFKAEMWSAWVKANSLHRLPDMDKVISVYDLALVTVESPLTVSEMNKWAKRGIGVYDAIKWSKAGYTAKQAASVVAKNASADEVDELQAAPVPGSSWRRVIKAAAKWGEPQIEKKTKSYDVRWVKDDHELFVEFGLDGKVRRAFMQDEQGHYFGGPMGVQSLETFIKNTG